MLGSRRLHAASGGPAATPGWPSSGRRALHRPCRALAAPRPSDAPRQAPQEQEQQFEQLRAWLEQRGGSVGAITAGDCRMGPVVVRGLVAQQDLAAGTPVLSVPIDATLRDDRAAPPYPGAPWNACLAAQLLLERRRGGASPLAPYLATLPAGCCSPLLLPPQQVGEVQYAPAVAAVAAYQRAAREAHGLCCQPGGGDDGTAALGQGEPRQQAAAAASSSSSSWEEWAWALHMVQSRSIRLAIAGCKVMIPGIDLLNHGGDAANGQLVLGKASWQVDGAPAVCFVTTQDIPAGQQVLWSYGRRGNDDFFAYHGFVLERNPDEDVVLFADVAQLVGWALQHVPELRALQQQQQQPSQALQRLAGAAAARAAQAAAAYCSSAGIPGTTSSLLAPLQQLGGAAASSSSSSSSGGSSGRGAAGGPLESAVLAALKGAQLHRRLASFRLHSPDWGASTCPPAAPELVLRRDGCLDVRIAAVLAALLDHVQGSGGGGQQQQQHGAAQGLLQAVLRGAVAARCREMLAAFPTSAEADQQLLVELQQQHQQRGGGGASDPAAGVMPAVVQYRLAKKQLLQTRAAAP